MNAIMRLKTALERWDKRTEGRPRKWTIWIAWIIVWATLLAPGIISVLVMSAYWPFADEKEFFERIAWLSNTVFIGGSFLAGGTIAYLVPGGSLEKGLLGFMMGVFGGASAVGVLMLVMAMINGIGVTPQYRDVESLIHRIEDIENSKRPQISIRYYSWNNPAVERKKPISLPFGDSLQVGVSKVSATVYRGRLGHDILKKGSLTIGGVPYEEIY